MQSGSMELEVKGEEARFSWLGRLKHFTWANFTLPLSTGGLALLLAEQTQGFKFRGLQTIGKFVYILDLVLFTLVASAITYRFVKFPGTLKKSIGGYKNLSCLIP